MNVKFRLIFVVFVVLSCIVSAPAQTTVYNNFGPDHEGWDYNYGLGWTVAGENVSSQYGVEQAMGFQSTETGIVTDIWVAFFYVPSSTAPDTVTVRLAQNPDGLPPEPGDVMEEWVLTDFDDWYQWDPPHHLQGNGSSILRSGENYWLWAVAAEETWTGWCMNIDPYLTCPHTIRREGEDWLPISNETASAFRVDVSTTYISPNNTSIVTQGFELLQNYPNPFNQQTAISFKLQASSFVELQVFDALGRPVGAQNFVPENSWMTAGTHEVVWDAGGMPTGVYFVRLLVDGSQQSAVRRMVLMK